jgi:hypothetical protein
MNAAIDTKNEIYIKLGAILVIHGHISHMALRGPPGFVVR